MCHKLPQIDETNQQGLSISRILKLAVSGNIGSSWDTETPGLRLGGAMLEDIDIKFQLEILEKLLKIRRHIDQLLTLELTETSLSMREWELLMYVGQLQKTNISKLASLSRTQKTLVSKNIWQLIKLGLVQSQVNQKDRRQLSFSMTIEGQKQIRTIERQVSRNLKNPQLAAELMGLSKQVMELSRKLNRISLKN